MTDDQSAFAMSAAVRARQVSAREVTIEALQSAHEIGPRLGAFVRVCDELALEQADAVDSAIAAGKTDSLPLAGVPCPIKDLNQVAGVPMLAGSAVLAAAPLVPNLDDGTVTALRCAGTTMIGKSATPEFGFPPYTEPNLGPAGEIVPARTPWDPSRTAGGSSGGAAVSVAAGISPIAHASDGGGSIRIPAACCGVVGFKASRGVVSSGPWGVDGAGLATQGAITRTVADAALALDVLARPWPGDIVASPNVGPGGYLNWVDQAEHLPGGGLRIGLLLDPVVAGDAVVTAEARAGAERAARVLGELGFEVAPAPVPIAPEDWLAFMPLWCVGALALPIPAEAEPHLTPLTRWLREQGRAVSGAEYAQAQSAAQQVARTIAREWEEFDVIVTPTLSGPPAPIGSIRNDDDPAADFEDQKRFTPWTSLANLTGAPSISLPVHRATIDGVELPFGAMLTGRIGRDGELLALARLLELADPWPTRARTGQ